MNTIVITLLPVGQGAMNLIEIYDGEGNLRHLTLIDCGVDKTHPAKYEQIPGYAQKSVDYVAAKMNERVRQTPNLYLDYVIFTHKDSDHWTLFYAILQQVFGSVSISNLAQSVRSFHNDINDIVSEDFYGNADADFFSYLRAYSWKDDNIFIEYHRGIKKNAITEETLHFHKIGQDDTEQDYTVDIDMKGSLCTISGPDSFNLTACIDKDLSNNYKTYILYMITGSQTIPDGDVYLRCPYAETPLALWQAWSLFITYLSQKVLQDHSHLDRIVTVLDEGLSNVGFLRCTRQDIIGILMKNKAITSVIGQFLWGGNSKVERAGIKKLQADSVHLAKRGAIEVYLSPTGNPRIQLLGNIYLDILARIPNDEFRRIFVQDAESTSNPAILNNGTSLVTMLSVHHSVQKEIERSLKFLFTGDATIHTFHSMRGKGSLEKAIGAVWTAPHHGSFTTSKGLFCPDKNKPDKIIPYFPYLLDFCNPQGMIIESGEDNKHGHPNISFYRQTAEQFKKTGLECEPHFVYVNNNDNKTAVWTMDYTSYPIYSGVSAEKNPSILPTYDDPDGLRNPIITYKIHRYTADDENTQYTHEEEVIVTGDVFRSAIGRRPGQPAPFPQALEDEELPPPPLELFFRR